jgi:hypothetical protein
VSDRPLSERIDEEGYTDGCLCAGDDNWNCPHCRLITEIATLEQERNAWKAVAEVGKAYIASGAIWDRILDDHGLLERGDNE